MIPQIICVVGPTATGKTKMGVALARRFGGEVVSVDSMQIYRGMAIGTAAPTPEEMEGIPHHMVGVADPAESWSVARFVSEADTCVQDILRRGRRPILVGGTGLYLESLIRGTDFAAGSAGGVTRQRLQQRLEQARCWQNCRPSTRTAPQGSIPATKNASSGRWRCGMRPARPSPSTTTAPGSSRPAIRPLTLA